MTKIDFDNLNCHIRDEQGDLAETVVAQLIPEIEDAGMSLGSFLIGLGQYFSNSDRFSAYNLDFEFNHKQNIGSFLIELGFGLDDVIKSQNFCYSGILGIQEIRFAIQSGYIFKVEKCERVLNYIFPIAQF